MSDLDPEDTSPAGPQDTQSSDQSKGKLQQAWEAWNAKPENSAALMQFGLAMLQPRAPGQSGVGQFANAVGQGAEASDRNIASQNENAKTAVEEDIKKRTVGAHETTANAYAEQVKNSGGGSKGLQAEMLRQRAFNQWLLKGTDTTGLSQDDVLTAIQQKFPQVKSKADVAALPAARTYAKQLLGAPSTEDDSGADDSTATPLPAGTTTAPATPTPTQGTPRLIYQQGTGKPFMWDGVPGHAPTPVQQ